MIVKDTLEELAEALEPARDQMTWKSPICSRVEIGVYKVSGSSGRYYTVTCGHNQQGYFFVACTCLGCLHGRYCYHALKAFETHRAVVEEVKIKENNGQRI